MKTHKQKYHSFIGLVGWSILRHKFYIPVFIVVQIALSLAVMYGFSFITDAHDAMAKSFLCTGAITINILAITCVLAPQIVNEAKQQGVLNYQKTLPIPRFQIIVSDLFIWSVIPLPGIIMSIVLGSAHFGMDFRVTVLGVCSLLFVIVSLLLLGFAIAYLLPPNIMSLITQVIMLVGLLFSPIIYAESRLPEWMSYIYNALPFVPVSNIIRASLFQLQDTMSMNYVVVFCWGACSLLASMYVLRKRK